MADAGIQTVADLAKQGKKHRSVHQTSDGYPNPPQMTSLPLAVVISVLIAMALVAVLTPMGVIFVSNAQSTANDLSQQIIIDTVQNVAKDMRTLRDRGDSLAWTAGNNEIVRRLFTTEFNDLEHIVDVASFFHTTMIRDQSLTNLMCMARTNLSLLNNPPITPPPYQANITVIVIGMVWGSTPPITNYSHIWVDYRSNSSFRQFLNYSNPGHPLPGTKHVYENVSTFQFLPNFQDLISANPSPGNASQYVVTLYQWMPVLLSSRNFYMPETYGPAVPPFACAAVGLFQILEDTLRRSRPTDNSILFMYEAKSALMIIASPEGASTNLTAINLKLAGQPYGAVRYSPLNTADPGVRSLGQALVAMYGDLTKVPMNDQQPLLASADIDGQPWLINTLYIPAPPQDWVLVVGMPRKDFFARVDEAQKRGIIVAVVVSIVGALTVSLASFFALRPLGLLAQSMKELTKFDFSSLEGGMLDQRSFIREISHLQETFSAMVNAFSVSIKKNRSLMAGGGNSSAESRTNLNAVAGSRTTQERRPHLSG
ncbi:hypothetical protein HK104_011453 [Borealophlyctis nickersoniae]|nr:hypothetical protein HK104_011453 [Borealophlyctis nickersoniae]